MFNSLMHRFDFKVNFLTFIAGVWLLTICPLILYAPKEIFMENGWIENFQLIFLIGAFVVSFSAKIDKKFFIFVGLIVILMLMRETNLGRYYFCEKYLTSGIACKWKNLKYGYFVEIFRWGFAIYIGYYFFYNKLYLNFLNYVKNAKVFVWDILFILVGILGGVFAEFRFIDNEIMEEACELLFYLSFTNCIWRYSRLAV